MSRFVGSVAPICTKPLCNTEIIRKTFYDGGVDEIIATRRLVHIINAYAIFKNKLKSVQVCVNRFDDDTKNSFLDLYSKVDSGVDLEDLSGNINDDEMKIVELNNKSVECVLV